jgi:hypothetical protein
MALPDEKLAGYNFKHKEEEAVESILDNEVSRVT